MLTAALADAAAELPGALADVATLQGDVTGLDTRLDAAEGRNTGIAVYLDVPIEQLRERVRPAAERPLIREEGDLEKLLTAREPLYREFAAHVVDGRGTPGEVADAIVEELRWSA
jgi:shikimate kinase